MAEHIVAWGLIDGLAKKGCRITLKPVDNGIKCSISRGQIFSKHVATSLLEAVRGAIRNLHNGDLFDWLGVDTSKATRIFIRDNKRR